MSESEFQRPICSIDALLFRIHQQQLQLALVRRSADARVYANALALPGGFVHTQDDLCLQDTLMRNLDLKVGFRPDYVSKLEFDGNLSRDPQGWSITCPFLGVVANPDSDSERVSWHNVSDFLQEIPAIPLPFDHHKLVQEGFLRLYNRAKYSTEPSFFFSGEFTLSELQGVYETILGKAIHKKNFRDRIAESQSLLETGNSKIVKRSRAKLYRNKAGYKPHFFTRVMQGAYDDGFAG